MEANQKNWRPRIWRQIQTENIVAEQQEIPNGEAAVEIIGTPED
jgi:hypothetical protein